MFKSLIKGLLSKLVRIELPWKILDHTILKATRYLEEERRIIKADCAKKELNQEQIKILQEICPDRVVKHGPFQGMKYPTLQSFGSALFPKLLGSYEKELHPLIDSICAEAYSEIIDIGCGEGYYAVGLAMRIPTATVYAYDTDSDACRFCKEMAELNRVGSRVITGAFCDEAVLRSIPVSKRCLIVCDCEGYEKNLFSAGFVEYLAEYDLLIETHDFIDITISNELVRNFQSSHEISTIRSIDDIEKAKSYKYGEIAGYDLNVKLKLLGERRPQIMEWLFLKSRRPQRQSI